MTAPFAPIERPETAKRKDPTLREKLASVLLDLLELRGQGIPFAHAREMGTDQIISLFQFDHAHRVQAGGSNHPCNLTARLIKPHREKTAKVDVPAIRKSDRLIDKEDAHRAAVRAKIFAPAPKPISDYESSSRKGKRKWPSQPWPAGRTIGSRPKKPGKPSRLTASRQPKSRS